MYCWISDCGIATSKRITSSIEPLKYSSYGANCLPIAIELPVIFPIIVEPFEAAKLPSI